MQLYAWYNASHVGRENVPVIIISIDKGLVYFHYADGWIGHDSYTWFRIVPSDDTEWFKKWKVAEFASK